MTTGNTSTDILLSEYQRRRVVWNNTSPTEAGSEQQTTSTAAR